MFKFFYNPSWFLWAYLGSATILLAIWLQVQIDVEINYWFGDFYDLIQIALDEPNSIISIIKIPKDWAKPILPNSMAPIVLAIKGRKNRASI